MKKLTVVLVLALALASLALAVAACGGTASGSSEQTTTSLPSSGGLATTSSDVSSPSSTDTTEASSADPGGSSTSDSVFQPHELLSAEEATALIGKPVTLDGGGLFQDEESGVISERYGYDLDGTGVHALVEIHQDGFKKSDGTVKDAFLFEKELGKSEITAVAGLGDDAFTHGQGQLHLLYGSYYIVVAFDADPYSTDMNAPLNIKIGTKILENLKAKLG